MMDVQVSAYPHMKKANQGRFFKRLQKASVVKPFRFEDDGKPMTTAQLADQLGRMLSGK